MISFQVALSQGDFTMLMSLLNENLSEGVAPPPAQPAAPPTPTSEQAAIEAADSVQKTEGKHSVTCLDLIQRLTRF